MTKLLLISLGSNLGDRKNNILSAGNQLSISFGRPVRESALYETAPFGVETHPPYLNQVQVFESNLPVREIFQGCCDIEKELGRTGKGMLLPRTIDIDILAYGHETISEPDLVIPHPSMHLRNFVLEPLASVLPEWQHPLNGLTAREMLEKIQVPGN